MRSLALALVLAACVSPTTDAMLETATPILSASFEGASAACNDWTASVGATAIRSVPARTGDYACKLCADGDGQVALTRTTGPLRAGRYVLSAYLRRRAGLAGPDTAEVVLGGVASGPVALRDDGYALATVTVDVAEGAVVDAKVAAATASGQGCFLVDDVAVTRE